MIEAAVSSTLSSAKLGAPWLAMGVISGGQYRRPTPKRQFRKVWPRRRLEESGLGTNAARGAWGRWREGVEMSRRAPAPGVRPTPATYCPGGVCGTGPSLPPFGFVQPATLSSVFPRGGPTAGGTAIVLRGHGFRGFDPGALCEFGALIGPVDFGSSMATAWAEGGGRLRDDAWAEGVNTAGGGEGGAGGGGQQVALNCTTPPMPMAEHTSVRARLSPSLHAASSVGYRYYDEPQARGLEPRSRPSPPPPPPPPPSPSPQVLAPTVFLIRCAGSSPPEARPPGARASRCAAPGLG